MSDAVAAPVAAPAPASSSAVLNAPPPAAGAPVAAPAGAPAVAPVAAPAAAPAAVPPASTTLTWLPADASPELVGYAQNKGWQAPVDVLNSYQNLEKLLGADKAGNAVVIPKHDADPKEWSAVFDKLGRPTGPDGYKVALPAGGDEKLQTAVMGKFHELGLTKAQGEALATWWNEQGTAQVTATEAARAAEFGKQHAQLMVEWGQAATQELAKAQVGSRALGLDGPMVDKISDAIGHAATMKLLARVGAGLSEDNFQTGNDAPGFGSAMTPGQAQAKITELKGDKEWAKRYLAGGAAEKAEMAKLMGFAYPEQK